MIVRRPGFTLPGNAAAAGRAGHASGATRQWTPDEARTQAHRGAEARWDKEKLDVRRPDPHIRRQ